MTTISLALREAGAQLDSETPNVDAAILLGFVLKKNGAWLLAHGGDTLPEASQRQFQIVLERRKTGEPIAHIIGSRGFWTLQLTVTADTLIPRPETELLVELAIAKCPADRKLRCLDLGTGTGAIALAIASERKNTEIIAVDKSVMALAVARENARSNHLPVKFIESDWFAAIGNEKFDLIVSNPPYIASQDPHLRRGDLRFEPLSALASGVDGLDAIRAIISQAPHYVLPNAWLMIEHGFDQGDGVRRLFSEAGFINIETVQDLEQRERVTIGQCI